MVCHRLDDLENECKLKTEAVYVCHRLDDLESLFDGCWL